MTKSSIQLAGACLAFVRCILAQQFSFGTISYESLGLSDRCLQTLNIEVACSDRLATHTNWDSSSAGVLDTDGVAAVCVDSCRESLVDLRRKILTACDESADRIPYNNIVYPATYMVDRYLYFYNVSCYKNNATGDFCDSTLTQWREQSDSQQEPDCHDCHLGPLRVQVSSPIGYDQERAASLASIASKCGSTAYTFTIPGAYGDVKPPARYGKAFASTLATANTTCNKQYVVKEGETCNSIAAAQGVSSLGIVEANNLVFGCKQLTVGKVLCLPKPCRTHTVGSRDICSDIASHYSITNEQLLAWNPVLNKNCTNIGSRVGMVFCVSDPNGGNSTMTADGDSAGDESGGENPHAPGTAADCEEYQNFVDLASLVKLVGTQVLTGTGVNGCWWTADKNGIRLNELLAWNPSLTPGNNCELQAGFSYCVRGGPHVEPDIPASVPNSTFTGTLSSLNGTTTGSFKFNTSTTLTPVTEFASGTVAVTEVMSGKTASTGTTSTVGKASSTSTR